MYIYVCVCTIVIRAASKRRRTREIDLAPGSVSFAKVVHTRDVRDR